LRENNPELDELSQKMKKYLRDYHHYRRPPTFTLPSPDKHPDWFQMERNEFYRNPDFENGTIQLQLIDEDENGIWLLKWFDVRIQCDPRLVPSYRAEKFYTEGRFPPYIEGKPGKSLDYPPEQGIERKAGIAGAKLMIKRNSYRLVFTVKEQNLPKKVIRQKVQKRTCSADNIFAADGNRIPIRILAIDLGIRHIGGYTVAVGEYSDNCWNVQSIKKGIIASDTIPQLFDIRNHDRELKKGRRKRGRPVSGEESFSNLQYHRTKMSEDRFKKGAHAIVEAAREFDVHLIVFEELSKFNPTAYSERWVNRQLRDMNRRRIVEMVKQQSEEWGIVCDDRINPYLTSNICSQCLLPGLRFSIKEKNPYEELANRRDCIDFGYPIWDQGGHLFRCPHCGYSVNADINAAGNLVNKFFGLWKIQYSREKSVYSWDDGNGKQIFDAKAAFDSWADNVKHRHDDH